MNRRGFLTALVTAPAVPLAAMIGGADRKIHTLGDGLLIEGADHVYITNCIFTSEGREGAAIEVVKNTRNWAPEGSASFSQN